MQGRVHGISKWEEKRTIKGVVCRPGICTRLLSPVANLDLHLCLNIKAFLTIALKWKRLFAALGAVALAAHTIVKQIIDFAMAIFGTFSTVAQTLVASSLGKVGLPPAPSAGSEQLAGLETLASLLVFL